MTAIAKRELQYLRICATCYDLYETERRKGQNQRCRCGPHDEKRWPGFDFNERVSLCLCCGTEALPSGSRWSPYFCRECQLLAIGVSLWHRRLVLPIGRHSMMHTFVPDTSVPTLAARDGRVADLAATVGTALKAVSAGTGVLLQWSAESMAHNLKHVGLRGGVRLSKYLAAVEKKGTGRTRFEAFAELCEFVRASGS